MDITKMLGAIPSKYDPRDWSVRMLRPVAYPETFEQQDVAIYDQGNIGNCVMQALRSCPHKHYGKEFGATFGYGRWRSHNQEGMYPNEACNGFVKDGIPLLKDDNQWLPMPEARDYANANATRLLKAAEPYRGWTWARMHSVDEIKATLMQGVRCIVCLPYVNISNGRWLVDGPVAGYHEMAIIGWAKDGWTVRNSWGKTGGLFGGGSGYIKVAFEDIFACDDVIALFPPEKKEDDTVEPRRTLRLKAPLMRGDDVKEYQTKVKAHGFSPGTIDGVFGVNSDKAAKAFQSAKGLVVDGIVGTKTWAALDKDPDDGNKKYDVAAIEKLMRLKIGEHYIIGAQGHELTKDYLDRRKASNPAYFTGGRYEWLVEQINLAAKMGKRLYCEDCSGLLMSCNEVLGFWPNPDLTAEGIRRKCKEINRSEVRPGDIAFRVSGGEADHMAWVGEAGLYEAVGTVYGVVLRTDIDDRKTVNLMTGKVDTRPAWTEWGRPVEVS